VNKWESGILGLVAATTFQVGEGTIALLVTAVVVPFVTAFWREHKGRVAAESKCERLQERLDDIEDETPDLHDEVRALRAEVHVITRGAGRLPSSEGELFPSRRSNRRPTPSRSTGRSRGSARGSDDGSGSGTGNRT
jgi:hypothetical protein